MEYIHETSQIAKSYRDNALQRMKTTLATLVFELSLQLEVPYGYRRVYKADDQTEYEPSDMCTQKEIRSVCVLESLLGTFLNSQGIRMFSR